MQASVGRVTACVLARPCVLPAAALGVMYVPRIRSIVSGLVGEGGRHCVRGANALRWRDRPDHRPSAPDAILAGLLAHPPLTPPSHTQ